MPFINKSQPPQQQQQQQKEDKYRYVEEILSASDYYHVLGIKRNATSEEIRRAYIKVYIHKHSMHVWADDIYNRKVESVIQTNLYLLILEQQKAFKVS